MFELNVRLQMAALVFVAIILFDFIRSRKVPTVANKNFRIMLICTVINLMLDITTVYTITHMYEVPAIINITAHKALYISIAAVVESFYRYVSSLDSDKGTENKLISVLCELPFACAVICAVVLEVWFYNDHQKYAYSQGNAVMSTFLFVSIQIIIIIVTTLRLRIKRTNKIMILSGLTLWVAVCVVQFLVPNLLLTGIGISMMMLFVYLSFENPAEYVDHQIACYNRFAFDSVMREKMHSSKEFVIINVVIDELNMIISRFGYTAGHQLMTELGDFLSKIADEKVYIFRDNSLCIFVDNVTDTDDICGQIKERLMNMWVVQGSPILVKGHADVLAFPDFAHNFDEIEQTLKYAGEHVSHDKIINYIGSECVSGYRREVAVLFALREAVKNGDFDVYYQPIYNVKKGAFTAAEALVRLKNSGDLGYVSPEEFIPIAEKNGLIMEIGEIVLHKVCECIREHELTQHGIDYVEVNVSGVQIVNNHLPEQISAVLTKNGITPDRINLEITETAAIESYSQLKSNMNRICSSGCGFSLDDFGTGYSNLSKIADYKFDIIKLDKSLIWPCFDTDIAEHERYKARVIMNNVINMINQLEIDIVAEGVETEEQVAALSGMGVKYLQGYYYSRPVNTQAFDEFITAHSNNRIAADA